MINFVENSSTLSQNINICQKCSTEQAQISFAIRYRNLSKINGTS